MAYYYVHDLGTANGGDTGRFVAKQTGLRSSLTNTYQTLAGAFAATTPPADGDIICVSDDHQEAPTTAQVWYSIASAVGSTRVMVVSVDDSNVEDYKKATADQFSFSSAGSMDSRQNSFWGIKLTSSTGSVLLLAEVPDIAATFTDCDFTLTGTSNTLISMLTTDSAKALFRACLFTTTGATNDLATISSAGKLEFIGCVSAISGGTWNSIVIGGFTGGGGTVRCHGCDFEDFAYIAYGVGAADTSDDRIDIQLFNCLVNSALDISQEALENLQHRIELWGCDDSTSDEPSTIKIEDNTGILDSLIATTATANIRSDGTPMTNEAANSYMMLKVITSAFAKMGQPFTFDMMAQYSAISNASTDNIRIYLACANTLNTDDVWVEVLYSDGTVKSQFNYAASHAVNPMMSDVTALDTDSGSTWSAGSVANKYQIDIDTSGDVASDSVPTVIIHVNKPSETIYFDSEFSLVAP